MYIAPVTSRQGKRVYRRWVLRTSYREDGKVKHKNLFTFPASMTDVEINALQQALKTKHPVEQSAVSAADIPLIQGPRVTGVLVLSELARRLGVSDALGFSRPARLALWLVMARLLSPGSRLSAVRAAASRGAADQLGLESFNEDHLYQALDWLGDNQERVEKNLYARRSGDAPPTLFLYDVTSSYLEGDMNELAAFGYNRDKKSGKKQIVIGLLTDGDGEPVAVRVFEGNTPDAKTVAEQVRTLAENFGVREVTLVGDRGMLKGPQIEALPDEFRYITAITKPQIRTLLTHGVIEMDFFDERVAEVEHEGVRYILRRNPVRADEIAKSRSERMTCLERFVAKQNARLAEHPKARPETALKAARTKADERKLPWAAVELEGRVLSIAVDEEQRAFEAQLDGCYALKTDLSRATADAETVHARYKDLARVEWAFRTFKQDGLEVRPVFLRNRSRTRGHVFAVMLAYLIERRLAAAWREINITVPEGIDELDALASVEIRMGDARVLRLPEPIGLCKHLLAALGITLPPVLSLPKVYVDTRKKLARKTK
jgi:hypothetical protein